MCGNCYKVRLAARQLSVAITLKNYGLHDGTTGQPGYLAKNPNGRVPMLEFEDGRLLPESGAILWYLSEGTRLSPADRWARAEALQWNAALAVMQTHLGSHDWFAGGRYSIADIALYGYTHCAAEGGFGLDPYPAVRDWLKRVAAEPNHIPLFESW